MKIITKQMKEKALEEAKKKKIAESKKVFKIKEEANVETEDGSTITLQPGDKIEIVTGEGQEQTATVTEGDAEPNTDIKENDEENVDPNALKTESRKKFGKATRPSILEKIKAKRIKEDGEELNKENPTAETELTPAQEEEVQKLYNEMDGEFKEEDNVPEEEKNEEIANGIAEEMNVPVEADKECLIRSEKKQVNESYSKIREEIENDEENKDMTEEEIDNQEFKQTAEDLEMKEEDVAEIVTEDEVEVEPIEEDDKITEDDEVATVQETFKIRHPKNKGQFVIFEKGDKVKVLRKKK